MLHHFQENNTPIILFYYNFRGKLQPIRTLLTYLQLTYIELHIECLEEEKKLLPPEISQKLKGLKIDTSKLPMLVHEDYIINDFYVICSYICRRFNRNDLFGNNHEQKARFQQIMDIYLFKQPQSMNEVFRLAEYAGVQTQGDKILKQQRNSYEKYMNHSGYLRQICIFLDQQEEDSNYIIKDQISVLDFLFYESCDYMLGMFDRLDENFLMEQFKNKNQFRIKANLYYLSVMRQYRTFFRSQPFFINNRQFLDSFSIISVFTSPQKALGLRKIWQGVPSLVK